MAHHATDVSRPPLPAGRHSARPRSATASILAGAIAVLLFGSAVTLAGITSGGSGGAATVAGAAAHTPDLASVGGAGSSTASPPPTVAEHRSVTRSRPEAEVQADFAREVASYAQDRTGTISVAAIDLDTGVTVSVGPHLKSYTASIVKADILAALLLMRQDQGRRLTTSERALARRMIISSDNNAASALWKRIGGGTGLTAANRRLGLVETVPGSGTLWGLTRTTVTDQLRLLQALTSDDSELDSSRRQYVLDLMADVQADQAWGVSAAAADDEGVADAAADSESTADATVPTGSTADATGSTASTADRKAVALKNGWLPYSGDGNRWIVNSIGRVQTPGGTRLLIAVLSRWSPTMQYGVASVEEVSRIAAATMDKARIA